MEGYDRMMPPTAGGTPTGPPSLQSGARLLAPPPSSTDNDSSQGWTQSGFSRRESAATFESASTMIESNYSGSSKKEGKEHLFMGDDGSSEGDEKLRQMGSEELLEDGNGGSNDGDGRTVLSMRAERVGGVSTFKTIAGLV